jgi:hypothetical protein
VNVPDYFNITTPNPMTDDVSKEINIPYDLKILLNDTNFLYIMPMKIRILSFPKGTIIPSTFNADWNIYLPTIPNTLCTSFTTSTLSSTNYSLFNFYNVKNSGTDYPGVEVTANNSTTQILFKL